MKSENQDKIDIFRVGGEPTNNIIIKKGETYECKVMYNNFNIKKLSIYFADEYVYEKKPLKVEIYENTYNSLVAEQIINSIEKGWNDFEFADTNGVFDEELIIKIIEKEQEEIKVGSDNKDNLCMKFYYEDVDKDIQIQLDNYVKEIRKIYNSSGWKFLVKLYDIRDSIKRIPRKIKKLISMFGKLIKNINRNNISSASSYIKENGLKEFFAKLLMKLKGSKISYEQWLKVNLPTEEELNMQREHEFEYKPLISILIPTYKTPKHLLTETLDSVFNQTYSNWELCIADGASGEAYIKEMLDDYAQKDKRVKVKYLDENKGIAGNTQECYHMATGDYIGLFDHDDLLEPNALYEVVKAVNEDRTIEFIYTDEDKINEKSTHRFDPHFKQDFAIDTFRSYNYICHFSVFRKDLMDSIGGFRDGFNGSQDYDIILRATYKAKNIHHIPKILYSWRVHSGSTAGNPKNKMYCYDSAKKAIAEDLKVRGLKGTVRDGKYIGTYEVDYDIIGNPKVSILIPTKDHIDILDTCIQSIYNKSTYKNYEVIVINNNSEKKETFDYFKKMENQFNNLKIIDLNCEFNFSYLNNYAVKNVAKGDYILLLNNDAEVVTNDWIEKMLSYAMKDGVGSVGAFLMFPDNTIQHAGVLMGKGGIAGHVYSGQPVDIKGYGYELAVPYNVSCCTAACLMIEKKKYLEVNGLNEDLKVAFNDVDFALRLLKEGYRNVFLPTVKLYHYESKSRGMDKSAEQLKRYYQECDYMKDNWNDYIENDPFYNSNYSKDADYHLHD